MLSISSSSINNANATNMSNTNIRSTIPCVKCTDGGGDFFRLENTQMAGYCPRCFPRVLQHKFVSSLGRNRVFKEAAMREALLVFQPGLAESVHLLQFTHRAMSEPGDHRRLRLNVKVLLLLDDPSPAVLKAQIEQNRKLLASFNNLDWHFFVAHMSSMFGSPLASELDGGEWEKWLPDEENLSKLKNLLATCQSSSVRAELLRLLRARFIARLAVHLQCSSVMMPESADLLAENALNALCFGRGPSMASVSAIVDSRLVDSHQVQFVRPLHDISRRELAALESLDGTNGGETTTADSACEGGGDIQQLTGKFIGQLRDGGFPATVSTILSVASKVDIERQGPVCTLCLEHFQPDGQAVHADADAEQLPVNLLATFCPACEALMEEMDEEGKTTILTQICGT